MEQQGVELRSVHVSSQRDEGYVLLNVSIAVMADNELEAIGWLVGILEGDM